MENMSAKIDLPLTTHVRAFLLSRKIFSYALLLRNIIACAAHRIYAGTNST